MKLRVMEIVSANCFWACPLLSPVKTEEQQAVFRLEESLSQILSESLPVQRSWLTGSFVAVRRREVDFRWVRARLVSNTFYGKKVVASVFLLDYGETLENLDVRSCVRAMPLLHESPPPLAVQVVLGKIHPASMDLDFIGGKQTLNVSRCLRWDAAALEGVISLLDKCKKIIEVRDSRKDLNGRIFGEVFVFLREKFLHLNELFVSKGLAVRTEDDFLESPDYENVSEVVDISHDEEDVVIDGSYCESESLEKFVAKTIGGNTAVEKLLKEQTIVTSLFKTTPMSNEDTSVQTSIDNTANENNWRNLVRKLKMSKLKLSSNEESDSNTTREEGSMWEDFQAQCSYKFTPESVEYSHLQPGGVLIGKRHEEILSHLEADNILDQKEKFKMFVSKL